MNKTNKKMKKHRKKQNRKIEEILIRSDEIQSSHVMLELRADTLVEDERTIDAVLVTENPIPYFDQSRRQIVDEVLLMSGCQIPDSIPMLNNHSRKSNDDVMGSITNMRLENNQLVCKLRFADMREHLQIHPNDEQALLIERTWNKVRQRHQREISAGYRIIESVIIEPNRTRTVNGKTYTAGSRPLRIATKWLPREGSVTPIAADLAARTRKEESEMDPVLQFLVKCGLRSDATMSEAWQFAAGLTDVKQRSAFVDLLDENTDVTAPENVRSAIEDWKTGTVASPAADTVFGQRNNIDTTNVQELVRSELATERQRSAEVIQMFRNSGVNNPDLQQRALSEGWDAGRVAQELLPMVRERSQPVDNSGHIGIHVTRGLDQNAMTAGLMVRAGVDFDNSAFRSGQRSYMLGRDHVLSQGMNDEDRQRAMDAAHTIAARGFSMMEVAEQIMIMNGERVGFSRDERIRSALSSPSVQAAFSDVVTARLLQSYMEQDDNTREWIREEDVNDFRDHERSMISPMTGLTLHERGKTADHMTRDAEEYCYRVKRLTGKFAIDEMDMTNDRLGVFDNQASDIARAAMQTKQDLVWATLMKNPSFPKVTDPAVFDATRNNYYSGAGSSLNVLQLSAMRAAMLKQKQGDRSLNLIGKYLFIPPELEGVAHQLLNSVEIRTADPADKTNGTANPHYGKYKPIVEARLSDGVTDPIDGTRYTGTASNFWMFADHKAGAKTMVLGYLAGTGRLPVVRSGEFTRGSGNWGMSWDVKFDIGASFEDYRGVAKSEGV